MIEPVGLPAGLPNATPQRNDPAKVRDAAQQFEALLLSQMMRNIRENSQGWLGTGEDQAGSSAMQLAEEQFAQALSAQGGLGLTRMIVDGLSVPDSKAANPQTHTPAQEQTPGSTAK